MAIACTRSHIHALPYHISENFEMRAGKIKKNRVYLRARLIITRSHANYFEVIFFVGIIVVGICAAVIVIAKLCHSSR